MTWPTKKLGEFSQIRMGETLIKKDLTGEGIPVYSADSLEKPWGYTSRNKLKFHRGTIVIGARGTIGSLKLPEDQYFTSTQTTIVVEPNKENVLSGFIFYFLNTLDFKKFTTGTGIPMITVGYLNTLKILIPPLKIQKQIVERLDKIVEAQKLNNELIQKSDELFQSLLHRELNPVGKNWEVKKLGDVCDVIGGGTPSREDVQNFVGEIPWVTVKDLHVFEIGDTLEHINEKALENSAANLVPAHTVLVATRVGLGKIAISKRLLTFNQDIKGLKSHDEIDAHFLFYILLTNARKIKENGVGATVKGVTQEFLKSLKIAIPEKKTQKQIVEKLSAAQEYKKQLLEQKLKLKELFESVLNKSMKGELVK